MDKTLESLEILGPNIRWFNIIWTLRATILINIPVYNFKCSGVTSLKLGLFADYRAWQCDLSHCSEVHALQFKPKFRHAGRATDTVATAGTPHCTTMVPHAINQLGVPREAGLQVGSLHAHSLHSCTVLIQTQPPPQCKCHAGPLTFY